VIEHIHPDGEPVPTARELYERRDGTAEATKWVNGEKKTDPPRPVMFRITDKGHALIGEIMRRNAKATLARGTAAAEAGARIRLNKEQEGDEKRGSKSTQPPA